jgi:hypothetical protein
MRIFIIDYSLSNLASKIPYIKKYLVDIKKKLEIVTSNGEYYIDNYKTYKMVINDKDIVVYNNYFNNFSLLVDYSYLEMIETSQVPNSNIEMVTNYLYFSLNKNSKIKFVVNAINDNIDDIINLNPLDFYIEVDGDIDINDIFYKDEINVFLSLLN